MDAERKVMKFEGNESTKIVLKEKEPASVDIEPAEFLLLTDFQDLAYWKAGKASS
jgi:hypothetical protein